MFNLCPPPTLLAGATMNQTTSLYATMRSFQKSLCMQSCFAMGKDERRFRTPLTTLPVERLYAARPAIKSLPEEGGTVATRQCPDDPWLDVTDRGVRKQPGFSVFS